MSCGVSDYRAILRKISLLDPMAPSFSKAVIAEGRNETERKKLENFLQRMQKLKVLRKGKNLGEWVFNTPLVRTAIFLLAEAEVRTA